VQNEDGEQHAAPRTEITCSNRLCSQPFVAIRMVPTISKGQALGRVYCPHCGKPTSVDPGYLWIGLPLNSAR